MRCFNQIGSPNPATFQTDTGEETMRSSGWENRLLRAAATFWVIWFILSFNTAATAQTLPWEEGENTSLHTQCWSLGASIGRVEGLDGGLAGLAGPDDGVIILEAIQNSYLDPYKSEELQFTLFFVNDFNLVQAAYGWRWSTVPFPKTFLRPWVGAYLTLNFLEDQREADPQSEDEQSDGLGLGLAAAAGITMRLSQSLALEAAVKGDQIFSAGWLDTGDFFADEFRIRGAYLRLLYFFKD